MNEIEKCQKKKWLKCGNESTLKQQTNIFRLLCMGFHSHTPLCYVIDQCICILISNIYTHSSSIPASKRRKNALFIISSIYRFLPFSSFYLSEANSLHRFISGYTRSIVLPYVIITTLTGSTVFGIDFRYLSRALSLSLPLSFFSCFGRLVNFSI